jgi:sugar/nucleoside kinase (ribokinase family)
VKPVIVAGHVCIDLVPSLDAAPSIEPGRLIQVGPLAMSPGGCVGNTGLALVSLGVPTQLVASVGCDQMGQVLLALLAESGADVSGIGSFEGQSTSYSIVVDVLGRDRTFWHHVGANAAFDGGGVIERIEATGPPGAGGRRDAILHLGYATHLPSLYADAGVGLVGLVCAARTAGATVSIDMAEIAATSEAKAVDWASLLARTLPAVDVAKASVDDLESMLPGRSGADPVAWADALIRFGAAVALVTSGAGGLYLRTAQEARISTAGRPLCDAVSDWTDREMWVPTHATRVVTTTGAGDAAAAGFLAGLAHGLGPEGSATLSAAAAAARISARPMADAYEPASPTEPSAKVPSGWSIGPDHVYRGPRDKEVSTGPC